MSDSSFLSPKKKSPTEPPLLTSFVESNRLQRLPPCLPALPAPFHLLAPFISLIVSFSSHPPLPCPYPPTLVSLFLLCPSLALPGACLSGSVPVCLFADDSTWSRCDAQQLLLCSAAAASPPHTHFIPHFISPSASPL